MYNNDYNTLELSINKSHFKLFNMTTESSAEREMSSQNS